MVGFTLVELILTMAIIAILSVIGIGSYTAATVKSRDTQRKGDLSQIVKAIEMFNNDLGKYPSAIDGVMYCPGPDGTEAPCGNSIFSYSGAQLATYMQSAPSDPTLATSGRKYVYIPDENLRSFALYAALENTEDRDVVIDANTKLPTDWGINCGITTKCNYKITEIGLIRSK
jgi:prepilin-type N-terminal cleavage/methylation domain-containing protein